MKIYVASSFKNALLCRNIGMHLRGEEFDAYVFCDDTSKAYPHSIAIRDEALIPNFTPKAIQTNDHLRAIYKYNVDELASSDIVLLVLPCGNSSHMEAGWIVGKGGKLVIFGPMRKGEFDAMYGMADAIFDSGEWWLLMNHLKAMRIELEGVRG